MREDATSVLPAAGQNAVDVYRKDFAMSIELNPDKQYVREVKKQIKAAGGYCPSALEKTADTKCMCKEFREMDEGMCYCGFYIKIKEDSSETDTAGFTQ